jgi:hypothetical protein
VGVESGRSAHVRRDEGGRRRIARASGRAYVQMSGRYPSPSFIPPCRFHLVTHPSRRQHTLSVEATRSTLRLCTERDHQCLHCTALAAMSRPIVTRRHVRSTTMHGARACQLAPPTELGLVAAVAGRDHVSPGSTATRSPISMPKSNPCPAAQSRGRGQRNLASCRQVAVAESWGRSKSRALASCVRPEWRR